jgi:hypothetical protein
MFVALCAPCLAHTLVFIFNAPCVAHTLVACDVSDLCSVYTLVTALPPDSNSNALVDLCKHTRIQSV